MLGSTITCDNLFFSRHAVLRMAQRDIATFEVRIAVERGEIIEDYPNDHPYPSVLVLAFVEDEPMHVVIALNKSEQTCIIVTMYLPDRRKWSDDFKRRRT